MGQDINRTLVGTVIKMAVNFRFPADESITLDSIDTWQTEWYCNGKKLVIDKRDHIRSEEGDTAQVMWYALVDTNVVGVGHLRMRLRAEIPDDDTPSGFRVEYAECITNVFVG